MRGDGSLGLRLDTLSFHHHGYIDLKTDLDRRILDEMGHIIHFWRMLWRYINAVTNVSRYMPLEIPSQSNRIRKLSAHSIRNIAAYAGGTAIAQNEPRLVGWHVPLRRLVEARQDQSFPSR
jgi:hypothetical protein